MFPFASSLALPLQKKKTQQKFGLDTCKLDLRKRSYQSYQLPPATKEKLRFATFNITYF